MRVRVVRSTVADGRVVLVGEVLDLSDEDGRTLVALRRAVAVGPDDTAPPDPAPVVAQVQHAAPPRRRTR